MLTDIFARRYQDVPLWESFDESARRLLVQGFGIVSEQLFPYYNEQGNERPGAQKLWDGLNKQLAMELGLKDLSARAYSYTYTHLGKPTSTAGTYPTVTVCENFVCAAYDGSVSADRFVKERLSFIEIAFQRKDEELKFKNSNLDQEVGASTQRLLYEIRSGAVVSLSGRKMNDNERVMEWERFVRDSNAKENRAFRKSRNELNARFGQAEVNLDYHNGFIQISSDDTIAHQVERPFWNLVSAPKWKNVDLDMKEAIDRRDTAGRDPALYAARALESTIKIISDERGWTTGKEKGASNYLDNLLSKKNGKYINAWEHKSLVGYFSNVRNPLGHGPGNNPIPKLTPEQADWAIEFCMIWIKNLIRRM